METTETRKSCVPPGRVRPVVLLALLVCGPAAGSGFAQAPPGRTPPVPAAAARADLAELRHQVYVMEGALVRAVEFGAQKLNREIRALVPDLFLLSGSAQAHGVYLDGYGIFFDVSVPMLRQSMAWGLRMMLQQDAAGLRQDLTTLREFLRRETDPRSRQSLEAALARLEAQASSFGSAGGRASTAPASRLSGPSPQPAPAAGAASAWPSTLTTETSGQARRSEPDPARAFDAGRLYTESVQQALIDAMLDFSGPMNLSSGEWLTVAARDNAERDALAPQDPYESSVTMLLSISGADLREYRSGAIDKATARARIRVSEF